VDSWIDIVGTCAAVLTTASFLPQVVQTWRSRSADDFSWIWILCFSLGLGLWLVYGLARQSLPLVAANGITLSLVVLIGVIKFRARH
jgi:MtN3 and saliva related transmembrane protein